MHVQETSLCVCIYELLQCYLKLYTLVINEEYLRNPRLFYSDMLAA